MSTLSQSTTQGNLHGPNHSHLDRVKPPPLPHLLSWKFSCFLQSSALPRVNYALMSRETVNCLLPLCNQTGSLKTVVADHAMVKVKNRAAERIKLPFCIIPCLRQYASVLIVSRKPLNCQLVMSAMMSL